MAPRRETYRGRQLLVQKSSRQWGRLVASVNGTVIATPVGATPEKMDAELEALRRYVDAADERRVEEPNAYGAYMFEGAPEVGS